MQLLTELLDRIVRRSCLSSGPAGTQVLPWSRDSRFRGDKMAATLDEMETFGLLLWRNKGEARGGVGNSQPQGGAYGYRVLGGDTGITTRWDGKS